MTYILDTNIFIHIKNCGFPFDADHMYFWNFLLGQAQQNYFKLPEMVVSELESGTDALGIWIGQHKSGFKLPTSAVLSNDSLSSVVAVYNSIRGVPLTEAELECLKADPYVIAHAITEGAIVVTAEKRFGIQPNTTAKNIKIPNICEQMNLPYMSELRFMWELSQKYAEFCHYQA